MDGGPLCFFIAYQHGGKSLPKIAMIFFQGSRQGTSHRPPVHGRPDPKSYAGGGPSFHTRAGRLGGVANPDTPGTGKIVFPFEITTASPLYFCKIPRFDFDFFTV